VEFPDIVLKAVGSRQKDMVTRGERGVEVRKNESFSLASYLEEKRLIVESALDSSLVIGNPAKIYEAMRYSLLAGGKRLRPILCLATCELMGGSLEMALPTACALEMIHTMSLIHDDLPAMDNDDYRRGKLTNHKVFGEDIALNVPPLQILEVIARLGRTVGAAGLVGGQVLDLESEGKPDISAETLGFIHTQKTGALLETSVVSGAVLAGAKGEDIAKLARYAQNIGLAFQIIDDVLDITATKEELGKTAGKDLQAQKATYPSLWGIEGSRQQAQHLIDSAINELSSYDEAAEPLRAIAEYIVNRKN
jgi:geranylgeranyl diphosphate synthase type II